MFSSSLQSAGGDKHWEMCISAGKEANFCWRSDKDVMMRRVIPAFH